MDCTLYDSFESGRWCCQHVGADDDAEPDFYALRAERACTLAAEWPDAPQADVMAHAAAWADGWLAAWHRR
jgi:hypothetical protein